MTTLRLATPADDAVIRSILRENAMPSWVEMAIAREPSFFAGTNLFGRDWAVIAEDDGDAAGMYSASVVPSFVDGQPEQLGYLGGLRVRSPYRQRIRFLREGYASVEQLAPVPRSVPWWFTVIGEQNLVARRLLERGLAGLPKYTPIGEYATYAVATSRGKRRNLWRRANEGDVETIVAFYNRQAATMQCAPVLDEDFVRRMVAFETFVVNDTWCGDRRLRPPDSRGASSHDVRGRPSLHHVSRDFSAVAFLWDQRAFKQIVARGYREPLGRLLPVYNAFARLARRVPLPHAGGQLEHTFLAFLAGDCERGELEDLLTFCETPIASIGLHAGHPLTKVVKSMRPIAYPARVYAVSFDGTTPRVAGRVQPEAALL
jgi:hypothetical protein